MVMRFNFMKVSRPSAIWRRVFFHRLSSRPGSEKSSANGAAIDSAVRKIKAGKRREGGLLDCIAEPRTLAYRLIKSPQDAGRQDFAGE